MIVVRLLVVLIPFLLLWRAWRSSPGYSSRRALQLAGTLLLFPVLVLGFVWALLAGGIMQSRTTQAVLGLTGIPALLSGAIVVISRIMDSHAAQLPPGVRIQTFHRAKLQPWILSCVAVIATAVAVSFVVPQEWLLGMAVFGGLALVLATMILTAMYVQARRYDQGLTAIAAAP